MVEMHDEEAEKRVSGSDWRSRTVGLTWRGEREDSSSYASGIIPLFFISWLV
jgi:hypothetical protein